MNCAFTNHNRVKNNFNLNEKSGCDGTSLKTELFYEACVGTLKKVKKEKKTEIVGIFQRGIPAEDAKVGK